MGEPEWLDGYSGEKTDELIALEGKYRTDSIVLAFEQAQSQKEARVGPDALTDEERVVLTIEALEREVNNGGYDQFFINTQEHVPLAVAALNRIGCVEVAKLTQEAIAILGIQGPITGEAIDGVLDEEDEELEEKLDECDSRYYQVAGDLADSLLAFIKSHKDKISLTN